MSSLLDKSLDEIIKAKPKARKTKVVSGVKKTRAATSKKPAAKVVASKKKTPSGPASAKKSAGSNKTASKKGSSSASNSMLSALGEAGLLATKVIVSNLPTDIDYQAVKQFFSHSIGSVTRCDGFYNSQGKSTGSFQLVFGKQGAAAQAVQKYNGTSIDNGKKIMKLDLVLDPTKKPLSARIGPPKAPSAGIAARVTQAKANTAPKKKANKKKAATSNGGAAPLDASGKTKKSAPKKRKPKKTLEELDAEMTDYMSGK